MSAHLRAIGAVLRKDLVSLWPMVAITAFLIVVGVVLANAHLGVPEIGTYVGSMTMLAAALLTTAVIQQDTAVSVTHDWLTRPIARTNLVAAKAAFIAIALLAPVVAARLAVYSLQGYSPLQALLAAVNVDSYALELGLPVVIAAAAITSTLFQAAAVLVGGVFTMTFLLPTLAIGLHRASALGPGDSIDETVLLGAGSGWMVLRPLSVLAVATVAAVLWLQYGRRKTGLARTVFAAATLPPLLMGGLIGWSEVLALQSAVAPEPPPADFTLSSDGACFAAESLSPSPDNGAPVRSSFARLVPEDLLERAGPAPVVFSSTVAAEGVPKGWRLMIRHVTARYFDASGNLLGGAFPAGPSAAGQSSFGGGAASASYWLLPRGSAERLAAEPSTRLALDYALTLLAPNEVELPVGGGRRTLPYVGYCSAELEPSTTAVKIDCIKRGTQPALITAGFAGALEKVDLGFPSYAPAWLAPLTGQRYELTLRVPGGVDRGKVVLTAYEARAHFDRRVETPGVLGGALADCPLPSAAPAGEHQQSLWRDESPHRSLLVNVDDGVRLEVLDWGGAGQPLVLLAGLGDSAHVYDAFAPKLAQRNRVYGISRRGHGASTVAEAGYDAPRLAEDVVRVLDALDIERPVVIGHSIAGEELNELGARHASRIAGLVYLDAVQDRTVEQDLELRAAARLLPKTPAPAKRDLASYDALTAYLERVDSPPPPEGEVLASFALGPDGGIAGRRIDPRVPAAIIAGVARPDYAAIGVPALAIMALPSGVGDLLHDWYDAGDPELERAVTRYYELTVRLRRAQHRAFEQQVPDARVIELPGAKHHVFISNE
ncbi:MAG TPA: alpha/beta hydrolase, partial [Gammaproteobacteria bacterium]|nr:alpha/beta hydrolase [Gammaproteobacteria bacterium]